MDKRTLGTHSYGSKCFIFRIENHTVVENYDGLQHPCAMYHQYIGIGRDPPPLEIHVQSSRCDQRRDALALLVP